ncbi:MAG: hypothetical protein AB1724_07260 [Thermodesulfobacteriota bacterium]
MSTDKRENHPTPLQSTYGLFPKQRFPSVSAIQLTLDDRPDVLTKDEIRICPAHLFSNELV